MRLDLYTGERERFLNYDCFCFTATNASSQPKVLDYTNCCPVAIDQTITIPAHDSVTIFGETDFFNPPPNVTISINDAANTCNECFKYNYKLYNCLDNRVVYTNYLECPDCIFYINQLARTALEPNPCWYVTVTNEPVGTIEPVYFTEGYCEPCEPSCYTITGTGVITYFDAYLELSTAIAPITICSRSYPSVTGNDHQIFVNGNPGDCNGRIPCPTYVYTLTNCATQEQIESIDQELAYPYLLNQIVVLAEYENQCWSIARTQNNY